MYEWSSVSESSQAFGVTTVFNNILAILIGNNISTVVLTLHFFIVEYLARWHERPRPWGWLPIGALPQPAPVVSAGEGS